MTRTQAIKQALQNLTIIDAIESPSAEDAATMGERVDQVRAELKEIGLVWWEEGSIPNSVAGAFCELAAAAAASAFGKTYDPGRAINRIAAVKSTAERAVVTAEYF